MPFYRLFIKGINEKTTLLQKSFNIVIAVALFVLFFFYSVKRLGLDFDFSFLWSFRYRLAQGFAATVALSLASLVVSLLIGFLSAIANNSRILAVSYFSKVYVQFIRGTPMIMQVYLFFYIVGTAWGIDNRFLAGVLILSIFEGAYIAEIIRGGIDSIEPTQLEAAKAVGLENGQTLRLIVLPQIIKRTLPALSGQFASIIKDSSLLSLISVIELTQTIREISASNFAIFESYIFLGLLYLSLTFPISMYTRYLESRFSYEN
ncbi:MAG: amino acid ABC transporter permease [Desulfotomaculaceae bacterium]|nr:amino acid ABC transporter permease [Desulfotomaculaceae bacterium]MDD4767648.1 amino acid ABC transporter permease [Desulfotomaculaceae bacterium]